MSDRPNILLFLPDQHRADWTALNTALPLATPNLVRLAERGIRFERAYCPSPLCAPARASLASGKDYVRCGVPENHHDYPLDQPTYYQMLRDTGYRVAGVGKFDLHKDTSDHSKMNWGLDGSRLLREWGFTEGIDNEGKIDASTSYTAAGRPRGPYMQFLHERGLVETLLQEHRRRGERGNAYVTELPDEAYWDNWIADNGLRILDQLPSDQPWHLVVNFNGPHPPFDVTATMAERWKDVDFPPPHRPTAGTDIGTHQRIRRHYAAMIENVDRHVGRFVECVRARGELERTVIVYASDHGEMLGDHGIFGKKVYYESSIRIPLIVTGPGFIEGGVSDAMVSLHDLAATFLEAAGARPLPHMDARSFLPVLRGQTSIHREHIISALNDWQAVVDRRHKLVVRRSAAPILHDLELDSQEDHDVSADSQETVDRLAENTSMM